MELTSNRSRVHLISKVGSWPIGGGGGTYPQTEQTKEGPVLLIVMAYLMMHTCHRMPPAGHRPTSMGNRERPSSRKNRAWKDGHTWVSLSELNWCWCVPAYLVVNLNLGRTFQVVLKFILVRIFTMAHSFLLLWLQSMKVTKWLLEFVFL